MFSKSQKRENKKGFKIDPQMDNTYVDFKQNAHGWSRKSI